jgi:hypothetical protein
LGNPGQAAYLALSDPVSVEQPDDRAEISALARDRHVRMGEDLLESLPHCPLIYGHGAHPLIDESAALANAALEAMMRADSPSRAVATARRDRSRGPQ